MDDLERKIVRGTLIVGGAMLVTLIAANIYSCATSPKGTYSDNITRPISPSYHQQQKQDDPWKMYPVILPDGTIIP
jgi:hypothetical protein